MVTQKVKENGLQKETGSEEIKRTRSSKGKSEAPIAFYDHRQVNPRSLRAASSPFSASAGRTKQQRRSRLSPAAVAGKEEKQSARSSSSLAIIRSSGTLKRRGACMFCLRASACNRRQLACGVFRLPSHDDLTPPPPPAPIRCTHLQPARHSATGFNQQPPNDGRRAIGATTRPRVEEERRCGLPRGGSDGCAEAMANGGGR